MKSKKCKGSEKGSGIEASSELSASIGVSRDKCGSIDNIPQDKCGSKRTSKK